MTGGAGYVFVRAQPRVEKKLLSKLRGLFIVTYCVTGIGWQREQATQPQ